MAESGPTRTLAWMIEKGPTLTPDASRAIGSTTADDEIMVRADYRPTAAAGRSRSLSDRQIFPFTIARRERGR
jgi:hypothetical protein